MLKPHLFIYLITFFMFACVRGCPFTGNSARSLSVHQKKCEAHWRDVAHSAEIRKSVAERSKRRKMAVQQRRNNLDEIFVDLDLPDVSGEVFHIKLNATVSFAPYDSFFI